MRRWVIWTLLSCVMVLSLVVSCAREAAPTTPAGEGEKGGAAVPTAPTTPAGARVPTGKVVVGYDSTNLGFRTMGDPHTTPGSSGRPVYAGVFGELFNKDFQGNIYCDEAESWKVAPDGSYMDITIRQGIKFHNGDPLTAKDVKFSMERVKREDLRNEWGSEYRKYFKDIEVIDDYHVRVHLTERYPSLEGRLYTSLCILPKDYIEKVGDAGFAAKPIGAGPFKWIEGRQEEFIHMEAYTGHHRQVPYIQEWYYRAVPEASTRLAMLKTGEADMIFLAPEHIREVQKDPNLKIVWSKYAMGYNITFYDNGIPSNPKGLPAATTSPFRDPRVQEATILAIDKVGIAHNVFNDTFEPWGDYLAPYMVGYQAGLHPPDSYDPQRARDLLAEAGYPNGFDTIMSIGASRKHYAEPVVSCLQAVGIRCRFDVLEDLVDSDLYTGSKLTGLVVRGISWYGRDHAIECHESHLSLQWASRTSPEIIAAIAKLKNVTVIDPEAEAKAARELHDIETKSGVKRMIWAQHLALATGPKVEEYRCVPGIPFAMAIEYLKLK